MQHATCSKTKREATAAPTILPTQAALSRQEYVAQQPAPEFLRLPKPGALCPHTGLTRSFINELILPTPRNQFKPPVRSFCIRQKGAATGVRLVDYASLRAFILEHAERGGRDAA